MGKWYNKIFVGNPDKEDFTSKDLPGDRIEQFFDVIKLRFLEMVKGNLVYALFSLPLVIWTLFFWFTISQADKSDAVSLVSDDRALRLYLLVSIPLYAIMGPAKAGLHYCLRNWVWNERATIGDHFWKEFKRSWWKSMVLNLVSAMVLFAAEWWISFFILNSEKYPAMRIGAIIVAIIAIVYFMSSIYHFPQLVTYNLTLRQIYKNSFIYTVVQFPRTLLAVLIYVALGFLCYVLRQVLLVVAMSIGMSFVFLGQTVYSNFLFDKYVNPPEARRRGMSPEPKKRSKR